MKPPFTYFGGKTRLAPALVDLMAGIPHDHYVEPFAGSLSVLLAKPPVTHETVNDLDRDLMTLWRVLRDQPEEFVRACAYTPHSRAEHEAAQDWPAAETDLERARRVWVRLTQGRAGILRRTGWRHFQSPVGSSAGMPDYLQAYVERMGPVVERLANVSLECRPALDVIADYGRHDATLLYVDPPYLASTRSSGSYQQEMGADSEHAELAAALRSCRAAVVLSGYPSPLYDDLYDGWHRAAIETATGQGGAWEARTEVVWSNQPIGHPDLFSELEAVSRG